MYYNNAHETAVEMLREWLFENTNILGQIMPELKPKEHYHKTVELLCELGVI